MKPVCLFVTALLFALTPLKAGAQEVTVSGAITDATDAVLPGPR